jgi:hypothetical protein
MRLASGLLALITPPCAEGPDRRALLHVLGRQPLMQQSRFQQQQQQQQQQPGRRDSAAHNKSAARVVRLHSLPMSQTHAKTASRSATSPLPCTNHACVTTAALPVAVPLLPLTAAAVFACM